MNRRPKESGLYLHAKRELELLGMFKVEDDDFGDLNKITAESILKMIEAWGEVGHSGASAMWTREIVYKLLGWENLSPLTSNPDEWEDRAEMSDGTPLWQNKRNPKVFSNDGGKTWWNVDDKNAFRKIGQRGGQKTAKRGKDYYRKIGRKGLQKRYGVLSETNKGDTDTGRE